MNEIIQAEGDVLKEEKGEIEWFEELEVTADELLKTVKGLLREATVRKIVIQNSQKKVLIEIPLVLGLAGIALLPVYAASALLGAMIADYRILVGRRGDKPEESKGS
ncbi:MAG TPA: DUF4342 domain-containing protein [candidate division Zixibacteria bacterium]|nr:DUF4342 domain-containing protein [candidate division Zixibacteria bacterium]